MGRSLMGWEILGRIIGRRPGWVIAAWLATTLAVVLAAPDLTRLLEGREPPLLPTDCESARAAAMVASAWPDRASASWVVAVLHRPGGPTAADGEYARRLAVRFQARLLIQYARRAGDRASTKRRIVLGRHDRSVEWWMRGTLAR